MGRLQIIKTRFSTLWQGAKNKCLRSKASEHIIENKNIPAPTDEFIKTTSVSSRPITTSEKFNFRQFLLGKKVDLKITPQEIKTLYSYEGEEFKIQALEFLFKKLNIPKDLKPGFVYGDELQAPMFYDLVLNTIKINPNFAEQLSDKTLFLATLRHEMQHFVQNLSMFRHESKGEELITLYTKLASQNVHTNLDKYARNTDIEQLRQIFDEVGMKEIIYLKELLKNNKLNEYEQRLIKIENDMYNQFLPVYTNLRASIVKNMGTIKKDTAEGKRIEKMFQETASQLNYWEKDGSINIGKYFADMREIEALTAQDMIMLRLKAITNNNDKYCYLKIMRETQEYMKKNVDTLNPQLQELIKSEKNITTEEVKKILSYLFD